MDTCDVFVFRLTTVNNAIGEHRSPVANHNPITINSTKVYSTQYRLQEFTVQRRAQPGVSDQLTVQISGDMKQEIVVHFTLDASLDAVMKDSRFLQ